MENDTLTLTGRHDPAIFHRARVVVDAMTACCILDLCAEKYGTDLNCYITTTPERALSDAAAADARYAAGTPLPLDGIPIGMRTLFFNSPSKISFYGCFSCFQVPKSRNCDPFVPHLCPLKGACYTYKVPVMAGF